MDCFRVSSATPIKPAATPREREDAATKIQHWFRAAKSHSMLERGEMQHSVYFPSPSPETETVPATTAALIARARGDGVAPRYRSVAKFREVSQKNLALLEEAVRDLPSANAFIARFQGLQFNLSHFTQFDGGMTSGISTLKDLLVPRFAALHRSWESDGRFSAKQIGNTFHEDIEWLGDTGFTFFHLHPIEFSGGGSRLGDHMYQLQVDAKALESRSVVITYDDRLAKIHNPNNGARSAGSVYKTSGVFYKTFIAPHIKHLSAVEKEELDTTLECFFADLKQKIDMSLDLHLLMGSDILTGMACLTLYLRSELENFVQNRIDDKVTNVFQILMKDLDAFMGSDLEHADRLNALINGWIRPIVRVPGRVFPHRSST